MSDFRLAARNAPAILAAAYLSGHVVLSLVGWIKPFELFSLILLTAAVAVALMARRGAAEPFLASGVVLLAAAHGLAGQRLAPDSLTSGAILLADVLILYVGVKIYEELSLLQFAAFAGSYFFLYLIFVESMDNAESIFLLSLMGLAATARSWRLLAYFWAMALSFSVCQPYPWETLIVSFLAIKAFFSLRGTSPGLAVPLFLASGFGLTFLVVGPILVVAFGEDLRNLEGLMAIEEIRSALSTTAVTATVATAILLLFGVPFGYALSRCDFFGKSALLSLIDLPIVIPQSAAGIALLNIYGGHQYVGEVFRSIFGVAIDGTAVGVCLAQIFVAFPFMVKGSMAAFSGVPPSLEQAARVLGANSFGAFLRVALPLASRGIFLAAVLSWARAAGEFGAVFFLAPNPETAPLAVYNRFEALGLAETAPLVALLILYSGLLFVLLQWLCRALPELHRQES